MSFVPVTGTATFRPAEAPDPPREGTVEFRDGQRVVELSMRAALPVLSRARAREDLHPSLGLLSGAVLLGMRLVAAGKLEPDPQSDAETDTGPGRWRVAGLDADDVDRVRRLAAARTSGEVDAATAEETVRRVLDAVADAMPRQPPPARGSRRRHAAPSDLDRESAADSAPGTEPEPDDRFATRLQARIARHRRLEGQHRQRGTEPPQLVRVSLGVEADEEELVAGAVRVVPQAHAQTDPLHVCDAARLFTDDDHGFGDRAAMHATLALRSAAEAWPVLDRLLELAVPDQITLDTDELASLLEHGVGALRAQEVDVLWPRSLGRDLTASTVLDAAPTPSADATGAAGTPYEEPLQDPLLGTEALFSFRWQLALHGDPLTPEEMDQLADAASPILKLRGGWAVVDPAMVRRARRRLIRTVKPAQAVAAALTGTPPLDALPDGGLQQTPQPTAVHVGASLHRVREQLLAAASREPVPTPAGLEAVLRDYQRHGLTWLADLTSLGLGACLADDMGLGKTVTLIALHLHRRAAGHPGPTLVVCPASLLSNWEAEVRRFAPGVDVRRFHGTARDLDGLDGSEGPDDEHRPTLRALRDASSLGSSGTNASSPSRRARSSPSSGHRLGSSGTADPGFVLTTYATMRRDHAALADVRWDLVVADEAQHVKNPRSSTARALRRIPSRARVALTGTPVENDLTELWAILDWATPGLLGSRNAFRKVWAAPIESGREPTKARQFADLIGPFLLRRRKSDPGVAPELPEKTETDHPLSLTREQVVLYEAFVRDTMARIEHADEHARRGLVLSLLTGLKQICNHPAHFLEQSGASRLAGRSEKLDLLDELLATLLPEGGSALVFTQYVAMARLLAEHLAASRVDHQLLHGGTPVAEREAMVERFQAGPEAGGPQVFLLSLKAGGTGLNLTRADHVVHLDRWWNPAVEEQATDRAHRIGQQRPVQVHRMTMRGTVEEKVGELLTRKRALAEAVLGRDDSGIAALTELSNEELRDLVSLRRDATARDPATS